MEIIPIKQNRKLKIVRGRITSIYLSSRVDLHPDFTPYQTRRFDTVNIGVMSNKSYTIKIDYQSYLIKEVFGESFVVLGKDDVSRAINLVTNKQVDLYIYDGDIIGLKLVRPVKDFWKEIE